jgi:uncharacterized membrane protein required for colicin V production
MWYDLVVLGILLYFAVRGASRGIISQLAGIAGIALCLVFAESISAAIGPMVSLQPPLNHWVVMFGSYLFFSFIAFGFARVMNDWIERAKLETFNRHLGMMFGAVKGVVLCLVLTFFLVTLSPAAREALKMSKSAHVAALIMDRIHPIMPEKLNVALHEYLNIHALDAGDANLQTRDGITSGTTTGTTTIPQGGSGSGQSPLWNDAGWSLPTSNGTTSTTQPARHPIDVFLSQLPASVTDDIKLTIARSMQQTPPDQWPLAQSKLLEALAAATPQQVQERLIAGGRKSVIEALAGWTDQFFMPAQTAPSTIPTRPTQTAPFPNQPSTTGQPLPSRTTPINPQTNPGWNPGSSIPNGTSTPGTQTPTPLAGQLSRRDQMLAEISQSYSSIPPVQLQVRQDIGRRLSGLPEPVSTGVVEDWWRDLRAPQTADPDPGTNANSPLETRILRQLDRHRVPVDRLSLDVQDRLEGATLQ